MNTCNKAGRIICSLINANRLGHSRLYNLTWAHILIIITIALSPTTALCSPSQYEWLFALLHQIGSIKSKTRCIHIICTCSCVYTVNANDDITKSTGQCQYSSFTTNCINGIQIENFPLPHFPIHLARWKSFFFLLCMHEFQLEKVTRIR